jgi:hypothetical protein
MSKNMIMKRIKTILILLMAVFSLFGQDITGTWTGSVTFPGGELRINFNISSTDEGYTSTLDSPDQDAYGIPVDSTLYKKAELTIKVASIDFVYVGTLTENNSIKGNLTQMGQTLELNLTKKEE